MAQPNSDELQLIKDFILLPILQTIVNKNLDEMIRTQDTLKKLYVQTTQIVMECINKDLIFTNKELRKKNIKVWEVRKDVTGIEHAYTCDGHQGKISLMRQVVKVELNVRLNKYISDVTKGYL